MTRDLDWGVEVPVERREWKGSLCLDGQLQLDISPHNKTMKF